MSNFNSCCQEVNNPNNKWMSCNSCENNETLCNNESREICENPALKNFCSWKDNKCQAKKSAKPFAKSVKPCNSNFSENQVCISPSINHLPSNQELVADISITNTNRLNETIYFKPAPSYISPSPSPSYISPTSPSIPSQTIPDHITPYSESPAILPYQSPSQIYPSLPNCQTPTPIPPYNTEFSNIQSKYYYSGLITKIVFVVIIILIIIIIIRSVMTKSK